MSLPVRIVATGAWLPPHPVTAADLDARLGRAPGWVERHSGVRTRYFAAGETASQMGAKAARAALAAAGPDVDCLVDVSGTHEQALPCGAVLVQRELGLGRSGIPAFDVDSTCLGFLVGLDMMGCMIAAGRYRRALLVASEVSSVALDWDDPESATILGDGAAAVVVERAGDGDGSRILAARMESFGDHAELARIRGGGTRHHPRGYPGAYQDCCLFEMEGRALYRLSLQELPGFVDRVLEGAGLALAEVDLVIPHQASPAALALMQRRLGIPDARWMDIVRDHGNTIAASIPLALHEAVRQGRLQRGMRVLLVGTSAGFSMGGVVLVY